MSERDDLFARLQSLVALAVHKDTPVEEARTSAVLALRIAVENGFIHKTMPVAADPAPPRPFAAPAASAPAASGRGPSLRDKMLRRGMVPSSPTPARPAPSPAPSTQPSRSVFDSSAAPPRSYKNHYDSDTPRIRAKFGGDCLECGCYIREGEPCLWYKGEGIVHPECG